MTTGRMVIALTGTLLALVVLLTPGDAAALRGLSHAAATPNNPDVVTVQFDAVVNNAVFLFNQLRSIVFVFAGMGLCGLALGSIFGKVDWKWFGALASALLLMATAAQFVQFFTGVNLTGVMNDANEYKPGYTN